MSKKTPFDFPESQGSITCQPKEQTVIPEDFPITKCRPSRRGMKDNGTTIRPRKRGRPLSWAVAEALAPDADKTYDEQAMSNHVSSCRHLSPAEAEAAELMERIKRLEQENNKLRD